MRRFALFAALAAVILTSCAATPLVVSYTMPTLDNAAACGSAPLTGPIHAPNGLIALLLWQRDGVSRIDSLRVSGLAAGQARTDTLIVDAAPGFYTVTAYALKNVSGRLYVACPASIRDTVSSKSDAIRFRP